MRAPAAISARDRWEKIARAPAKERSWQAMRWDWFALLRLIQCAHPELPRLGQSVKLSEDPVRLGQPAFFHPPATSVAGLRAAKQGSAGPLSLYSYHLGFFGPFGALPLHLTELASQRDNSNKRPGEPFWAFCNVLTHRFLCFFFWAWSEGRKEMALDRSSPSAPASHDTARAGSPLVDPVSTWEAVLADLVGCGLDAMRDLDRVPQHARLFYSGRLLQPTRSAEGLRSIIADYFGVPAQLFEFQPRRLPIPLSAQWRLGLGGTVGSLGVSTLVGSSIEDHQSGFRLRLGDIDRTAAHFGSTETESSRGLALAQLESLLPDAEGFGQLHDWIRFYCGLDTDPNPDAGLESAWDLQLVLRGSEVPPLTLSASSSVRLGYTTWLCSKPPTHDVDDLVIRPRGSQAPVSAPFTAQPEAVSVS